MATWPILGMPVSGPPTFGACRGAPTGSLTGAPSTSAASMHRPPAGRRPSYVAVSGDERYLSIFVGDEIDPWIARHGLTSPSTKPSSTALVPLGYDPICVQGGGSGAGIRFAVIFAKQETPLQREWNAVGVGNVPAVDQVMLDTLRASNAEPRWR